jgi:chromate transporter
VLAAAFAGVQAGVAALIVRALYQIGAHALADRLLWLIAIASAAAALAGLHFMAALAIGGVAYFLRGRNQTPIALALLLFLLLTALIVSDLAERTAAVSPPAAASAPSEPRLLWSGLRTGLLTFGGAYTAIPILHRDAVIAGRWITEAQFLDGVALAGVLPAPLIIFATFVGYVVGGPAGGVLITLGVFVPAFGFTLIGHDLLERWIENPALHHLLDGVMAAVVGLIAASLLQLFLTAVPNLPAFLIFGAGLGLLVGWRSRFAVPAVVLASGLIGLLALG